MIDWSFLTHDLALAFGGYVVGIATGIALTWTWRRYFAR